MEKIKEIIATFIHKTPDEIDPQTFINKKAINGSILIHRMYAALADAGYKINDYADIDTFGALCEKLAIKDNNINNIGTPINNPSFSHDVNNPIAIGIDIEKISSFKKCKDYREDTFYKSNFSPTEISYCILQTDPLASFAGKFAAKEAIIKANNALKNTPFHAIEIKNDQEGKPGFLNFALSISHTEDYAIACAAINLVNQETPISITDKPKKSNFLLYLLIIISLLLSVFSIFFA
jgi:phosphopantetheine--protein transferase-like protein